MALSQSSTETEVVSLDTGLRMEGSLASKLLNIVSDVLEPPSSRAREEERGAFASYQSQNPESQTGIQ